MIHAPVTDSLLLGKSQGGHVPRKLSTRDLKSVVEVERRSRWEAGLDLAQVPPTLSRAGFIIDRVFGSTMPVGCSGCTEQTREGGKEQQPQPGST